MFKQPRAVIQPPPPDPGDLANRRDSERSRRLASGGRQSTLITRAVEAAGGGAPAPSAVKTGTGG